MTETDICMKCQYVCTYVYIELTLETDSTEYDLSISNFDWEALIAMQMKFAAILLHFLIVCENQFCTLWIHKQYIYLLYKSLCVCECVLCMD